MKPHLEPCPFCGSKNIWLQNTDERITNKMRLVYYACNDCKAYGPDAATPEEAAELWNKRVEQWISDHLPEEGELVQIGDSVGYWYWESNSDYESSLPDYRQWYKLIEDRMEPLDGENYPKTWRPLAAQQGED